MPTPNTNDAINPDHYKQLDPEPIVVIEKWGLGFLFGNALKYLARAGRKPGADAVTDIRKAIWYLERAIGAPASTPPPAQVDADLVAQLEDARTEIEQWRITARALNARVHELAALLADAPGGPVETAIEQLAASSTERHRG